LRSPIESTRWVWEQPPLAFSGAQANGQKAKEHAMHV
jgi:hypothetical protein